MDFDLSKENSERRSEDVSLDVDEDDIRRDASNTMPKMSNEAIMQMT